MVRGVEVNSGTEQIDVRLRLRVFIQGQSSLTSDNCLIANKPDKVIQGAQHGTVVRRTDRIHCDDLAADELNAVVLSKNSCIGHAVIVVDGEQPS